jgi:putative endonuclease
VNRGERRAARHYRLRGYRLLASNVFAGGYELDLIVRRGRRLVFSEVKEKRGPGFGDPLEMVDDEKRRRIRHAAAAWLARNPDVASLDIRFEVVAIRGRELERIADW